MPLPQICGVTLYSPRGQCIFILLAACRELTGSPTKQECLSFITDAGWFNKSLGQDLQRYPGQVGNEPRWKTLFSFARLDAVEHECILRGETGAWPISTRGREEFAKHRAHLFQNDLRLRLMFMTTPRFKNYIQPGYEPNDQDLPRPASIYEDDGRYLHHDIEKMLNQIV